MARPRPMAVVKLRANTDTSVAPAMVSRATKVPRMEKPPAARGRKADVKLPKISTSRMAVTGKAISSAVRAAPASAAPGSSTPAPGAVASSTTWGEPAPKVPSRATAARSDSLEASMKPPGLSDSCTSRPVTAA